MIEKIELVFFVIKTLSDKVTQQTHHVSVLKKDFTWKVINVNNLNVKTHSILLMMQFLKKTIVHVLMIHMSLVKLVDVMITLPWLLINVFHAMFLIVNNASKKIFVLPAKINTTLVSYLTNVHVKVVLHNHQLQDVYNAQSTDVNNAPLKMFVLPVRKILNLIKREIHVLNVALIIVYTVRSMTHVQNANKPSSSMIRVNANVLQLILE